MHSRIISIRLIQFSVRVVFYSVNVFILLNITIVCFCLAARGKILNDRNEGICLTTYNGVVTPQYDELIAYK